MEPSEALCAAIQEKSETLVLQLLKSGVDPTSNNNEALLYAASFSDCENIINLLLQYGAKANRRILYKAAVLYDEGIVEKLLQHGANAKELGDYNQNVLHEIRNSFGDKGSKVCELLIKYGAEVNQQSQNCRITPLWNAIERANHKVIEVLLQYGAQPCREMDAPRGIGVPLQYCFTLKASTIDSIVKYAALQVDSSDDREVQKFFQYIANGETVNSDLKKKYAKFARDSLGEINILKEKILNKDRLSLFDFVVSQHAILESYKCNSNIVNRVLDHIISTPFPIYHEIILKKLERSMIVRKFAETPKCRWYYVSAGRKSFVNSDCIELIAAYLSVIDLGNLLVALTTVS